MSYYSFKREKKLKNGRNKYRNEGGKEKLLSIILIIKKFQEKMQEINIETCQKRKKKRKGNIKETDFT